MALTRQGGERFAKSGCAGGGVAAVHRLRPIQVDASPPDVGFHVVPFADCQQIVRIGDDTLIVLTEGFKHHLEGKSLRRAWKVVQLIAKAYRLLAQLPRTTKFAQHPAGMCKDGPRRHPRVFSVLFSNVAVGLSITAVQRQFKLGSGLGQVPEAQARKPKLSAGDGGVGNPALSFCLVKKTLSDNPSLAHIAAYQFRDSLTIKRGKPPSPKLGACRNIANSLERGTLPSRLARSRRAGVGS